ncbi:Arc family DNA-binding protein [Xenorhabdus lircayensis]|uniref:Arc family DNA-binding protein n=1 Tax=Xenorhabdus lircayensis TaxID=2763499 RepID=A0ABS0U3W9_9GAMM|nr:Arc family DNA-binding protein [Xenorhabdus lircayensis]MBI6548583.1 Arc family DNA-binding protein [Xenorhabdus lircayensis]
MSRDPQINIRLPQDLKDDVQSMASDNMRSVNAEIVAVLLDAVRKHKLVKQGQPVDEEEYNHEQYNHEQSQKLINLMKQNEALRIEFIGQMHELNARFNNLVLSIDKKKAP